MSSWTFPLKITMIESSSFFFHEVHIMNIWHVEMVYIRCVFNFRNYLADFDEKLSSEFRFISYRSNMILALLAPQIESLNTNNKKARIAY